MRTGSFNIDSYLIKDVMRYDGTIENLGFISSDLNNYENFVSVSIALTLNMNSLNDLGSIGQPMLRPNDLKIKLTK